jgi:Phage integrase, N-terminal SAM-like domain
MAHIQKKIYTAKRTGERTTVYQARYMATDGKQRTKRFSRKVDAQKWLDTNSADIIRGQWIDPAAGRIKFSEWAEKWKETTVDLRPSTRSRDLGYLDRYLMPTFGNHAIADIDFMAVSAWVARLGAVGPKPWWDIAEQEN